MTRFSFLAVLVSFFLVACGGGTEPQVVEEPADMQQPDETVGDLSIEEPAEPPENETLEAVEESSGDGEIEDNADQPLLLAQANVPVEEPDWQFEEGTHYGRLVPTQPTVGGADKIEVAEVFWYGCNHCNDFEPFIDRWLEDKPPNVRFVRIPATWNPLVQLHAQLFYTEEVLVKNGKIAEPERFRSAVFAEYHRRGNRMTSVDEIQKLFNKHGVNAEDFETTWNSFEVAQKLRVADDLTRRYEITGVPAVVVNGKYRAGAGQGGYPELLKLVDELIVRESIR